jgi:hypothetical protein
MVFLFAENFSHGVDLPANFEKLTPDKAISITTL